MPATSLLLMWAALPRGIDTSTTPAQARLSVLLSPRVSLADPAAPVTLADVPDLLDWPARLVGLTFTLEVDPGSGSGPVAVPAAVHPGPLDSALWQALLPGTAPVRARVFDQDQAGSRPVLTYSKSVVLNTLEHGYAGIYASHPVELPHSSVLAQAFPALAAGRGPRSPLLTPAEVAALDADAARAQHEAVVADLVAHARAGTLADAVTHARALAAHRARLAGARPGLLLPGIGTAAGELGRLLAFHAPPSQAPAGAAPTPFEPELHSVITLLHEHPALLSRLGLLVDLTVPAGALPQVGLASAAQALLRVTVTAGSAALQASTAHYSPWTVFVRDGNQVFTPRAATPAAPEVVAGLLNLALPGAYTIGQVDEDGTALKAAIMAAQPLAGSSGGLPAVRTTGPSLIRAGQGETLLQRIQQAAQNENTAFGGPAPQPVMLFAEDLMRGYRVDIRDHADGVWRSLHERDVTYSVPGVPDVTIRDEGAAQPSGMLDSADPQRATTLSVHESLARWEGWSLSVQRPGLAVDDDGPTSLPSAPQAGGVPLTSSLAVVPGSLPQLRFGHSYDVRARAVDLGGGGLDVAGADAMVTLLGELTVPLPVLPAPGTPFTFQRFEPVPSPVAVPREKATEGESVERLVIRSSRTETAEQVAARLNALVAAAIPDTGVRYLGVSERHLVPPRSSQQAAERAGLLDGMEPAAAYFLCCKDKGRLDDDAVIDITTGQPVPLADVPDPFTGGTRPAVEVVTSGTTVYPVHHEASLLLPYLPDWLAVSAVLSGLPGVPAGHEADIAADGSLVIAPSDLDPAALSALVSVTTVPFTGSWPQLMPLRLRLTEGDGPPAWDPAGRVLSVSVPQGRTATVRVSCALPGGALDLLGQWQWLVEHQVASQQPPPDAAFAELAQRGLTWPLTPFREITLVHACQQPMLDPDITTFTATRMPGDTGAALSGTIGLDAASTAKIDLIASWTDPTEPGQPGIPATAHVLEAVLPPGADIGQLEPGTGGAHDVLVLGPAAAGGGQRARQEFGDTRHRRVTYQAVASTRFLEYFPSQVDVGPTSVPGTTFAVDVPSSAAPPAPVVREAVPTWQWDRPADPALPHRRHRAGVRLLLEPPWFVSGDGEQLAVVLLGDTTHPPSDDTRPRVTHWGADPAFDAAALVGAPTPAAFLAGLPAVSGQIDGVGAVVLVPHAVSFDADRGLCVCDIPIDPGEAYGPFVRLAVVRYQPNSLPGLEASHVVQVPFVQVLPERRVLLTPPAADAPDTFAIQVEGITYSRSGAEALPDPSGDDVVDIQGIDPVPPLVEVVVQERLPGTTDEAGWAPTLHPAVTVTVDSAVSGAGLQGAPLTTALWAGRVTLPAARTPGQFRILVMEQELLESDAVKEYSYIEIFGPPEVPHPTRVVERAFYRPGSRRLVFAEELII